MKTNGALSHQRAESGARPSGMHFRQDIRHARRLVRKAPWFTAAAVSVLGVGIGATTAIFSLDAALVRPLPFKDANRLLMVWERSATNPRSAAALGNFYDWRQQTTTAVDMAGLGRRSRKPWPKCPVSASPLLAPTCRSAA
jgi:hypothetical protein